MFGVENYPSISVYVDPFTDYCEITLKYILYIYIHMMCVYMYIYLYIYIYIYNIYTQYILGLPRPTFKLFGGFSMG